MWFRYYSEVTLQSFSYFMHVSKAFYMKNILHRADNESRNETGMTHTLSPDFPEQQSAP